MPYGVGLNWVGVVDRTDHNTEVFKSIVCVIFSSKVTVTKDKDAAAPAPPPHVPMPDLTSQPLDPNEPTYCLCQQVSFGEMIGCDNDDVSSEWLSIKTALLHFYSSFSLLPFPPV